MNNFDDLDTVLDDLVNSMESDLANSNIQIEYTNSTQNSEISDEIIFENNEEELALQINLEPQININYKDQNDFEYIQEQEVQNSKQKKNSSIV